VFVHVPKDQTQRQSEESVTTDRGKTWHSFKYGDNRGPPLLKRHSWHSRAMNDEMFKPWDSWDLLTITRKPYPFHRSKLQIIHLSCIEYVCEGSVLGVQQSRGEKDRQTRPIQVYELIIHLALTQVLCWEFSSNPHCRQVAWSLATRLHVHKPHLYHTTRAECK